MVLDWNDSVFWRGKKFCNIVGARSDELTAKMTPALSDHLVNHSFEFDIELKKCQSLHFGLAGIAT